MSASCGYDREQLSALVDGELPRAELRRLALHVLACPECSRETGLYAAARQLVAAEAQEAEAPAGLWEGTVRRLDEVDGVRPHRLAGPTRMGRALALAAVGLLVITGALLARHSLLGGAAGSGVLLARAHEQIASITAPPSSSSSYVALGAEPTDWRPMRRALIKLGGVFVEHTLFAVNDWPVSVFVGPADWNPITRGTTVRGEGGDFLAAQLGAEVAVTWTEDGQREVLVARAPAEEVLRAAQMRRAHAGRSPGL